MTPWWKDAAPQPSEESLLQAQQHQEQLTKPPGSLGRLEEAAVTLASLQASSQPQLEQVLIAIFAGDHGVANAGVSAFPQVVTAEMVRNFSRGGAAISVLARELSAELTVVNVGTVNPLEPLEGVVDRRVANGTANFMHKPAMNAEQLKQALDAGREAVEAHLPLQLFIGGEMGIANTTSAAALAAAITELPVAELVGRGTGLDESGVQHKCAVVESALLLHRQRLDEPESLLAALGGFEIAGLVGAYIAAAQSRVPVLVDGFICSVAAMVAVTINPSVRPWLLFSHRSAESGHHRVIEWLKAKPLLDLDLRLGEASGAAVALPLLRLACVLHNQMASFADAGVSTESLE